MQPADEGEYLRQIHNHKTRRLQILEEKNAIQGISTPPEVLIEIENLQRELKTLNTELRQMENTTKPEPGHPSAHQMRQLAIAGKYDDMNLVRVDLSGFDLRGVSLVRANLFQANLSRVDLRGANLFQAELGQSNLRGTVIDDSTHLDPKWRLVWRIINQSKPWPSLRRADLSGADLRGLDFAKTNLRQADLSGADLRQTNLQAANLYGATLFRANLRGADLRRANLRLASLGWTDLHEAELHGADFSDASYDQYTQWPVGFDPHQAGAISA